MKQPLWCPPSAPAAHDTALAPMSAKSRRTLRGPTATSLKNFRTELWKASGSARPSPGDWSVGRSSRAPMSGPRLSSRMASLAESRSSSTNTQSDFFNFVPSMTSRTQRSAQPCWKWPPPQQAKRFPTFTSSLCRAPPCATSTSRTGERGLGATPSAPSSAHSIENVNLQPGARVASNYSTGTRLCLPISARLLYPTFDSHQLAWFAQTCSKRARGSCSFSFPSAEICFWTRLRI
jgi:hypothetical protein